MNRTKNLPLILVQICFALFLVWNSIQLYTHQTDWIFMNSINLIFHEAGHVIFSPFGNFLHMLGGTLAEILIPLIVIGHFLLRRQLYSVGFGLWWLSIAFWSISVYARDARTQSLPLLGGDSVGHDWTNILGQLGILRYDYVVGNIFLLLSILACISAIGMFFYDTVAQYRKSQTYTPNSP